jgi:hypothetical protein
MGRAAGLMNFGGLNFSDLPAPSIHPTSLALQDNRALAKVASKEERGEAAPTKL